MSKKRQMERAKWGNGASWIVFILSLSNKHGNYVVCHSFIHVRAVEGKNWLISINKGWMHSKARHGKAHRDRHIHHQHKMWIQHTHIKWNWMKTNTWQGWVGGCSCSPIDWLKQSMCFNDTAILWSSSHTFHFISFRFTVCFESWNGINWIAEKVVKEDEKNTERNIVFICCN